MATTSEARALPFFTDLYGQPLSSGFIYIGQPGLDPVAYPAVITSDIAGTTVVAQPVRTTNGHAAAAGALIHLFVPIPYSITILDSAGRTVYASLNETDPVALAVASSSVQSAADLTSLRARSGSSTNQVWVSNYGMYVYVPTDTTSPENVPTIIVANDGSRYHLSQQYVDALWAHISGTTANLTAQGTWLTWNDSGDGVTTLTNNEGLGAGGFLFRNVNSGNTAETGRVSISPLGAIAASALSTTGNIGSSTGSVTAGGGVVGLNPTATRSLNYDGTQYVLPSANLLLNGSLAVTLATLGAAMANIFVNRLVGAVVIGNATAPTPGTWFNNSTGTDFMWVRTA